MSAIADAQRPGRGDTDRFDIAAIVRGRVNDRLKTRDRGSGYRTFRARLCQAQDPAESRISNRQSGVPSRTLACQRGSFFWAPGAGLP
jgi:hypothetical protein